MLFSLSVGVVIRRAAEIAMRRPLTPSSSTGRSSPKCGFIPQTPVSLSLSLSLSLFLSLSLAHTHTHTHTVLSMELAHVWFYIRWSNCKDDLIRGELMFKSLYNEGFCLLSSSLMEGFLGFEPFFSVSCCMLLFSSFASLHWQIISSSSFEAVDAFI